MQRIASLGPVLIGFALGLLTAHFWAEVPKAESAKTTTWRYLALVGGGSVYIHNPTPRAASVELGEPDLPG